MMHPVEFIDKMISEGKKDVLIDMVDNYNGELRKKKTNDHRAVYNFVFPFLIRVCSELREVKDEDGFDIDEFFSHDILHVWAGLAYFGLDRIEIQKYLDENES